MTRLWITPIDFKKFFEYNENKIFKKLKWVK